MHHAAHKSIALVFALAGTAAAGEPAAPARNLVPTRTAGAIYINLATGERSLTLYGVGQPAEIDVVNTAALFNYWMSVDENPCWDDARADGFAVLAQAHTGGPPGGIMEGGTSGGLTQPIVMWDYGDLPFDSVISGLVIKVATTAIDDTDSNGDGTPDSGIDSVSVFYDGLSDSLNARSSNAPPTAAIRVEAVPGRSAANALDTEIPDFDIVVDFGGTHFELGDSDSLYQGELNLPGAAPGKDISALITTCTTTAGGEMDCTITPNPFADGLADIQYLQYYTKHNTQSKVTSASTYISLGTPQGTVSFTTYSTTTHNCSTSGGRFTTCSDYVTVTSTFFTPGSLPQAQSAFESFGIGSLASSGSLDDIDPIGASSGCCYWFGGLDCAGFLAQLDEEPQFNETYYNFGPYAQISMGLFNGVVDDTCLGFEFNGDGILDNGDIGAYIMLYLSKDPVADLNGDGITDNGDIGAFVWLFLYCGG